MKPVMTDRIRRFFFEGGLYAYEIEKNFVPRGLDEEDRVFLRLSNRSGTWTIGFGKENKASLLQFADDLLEMAEKL